MPEFPALRALLRVTGPLVSTSANISGNPSSAKTIKEAQAYFRKKVDFYVDRGVLKSAPSTLISIKDGKPVVERLGAVKISNAA